MKLLKIIGAILAVLGVIAIGVVGRYYYVREQYRGKFLLNTTVNGVDMTGQSLQDFADQQYASYPEKVTVIEKDGTPTVIELAGYITNERPEEITRQEEADLDQWFMRYFEPASYTLDTTVHYEDAKLQADLENALNQVKRTPSEDAYLDNTTMTIVPETYGNEVDAGKIAEHVVELVNQGQFEYILQDEYLLPKVYQDDKELTAVVDEYKARISRTIPIHIADALMEEITGDQLEEWITYDGKEFCVDEEAVREYSDSLAVKYNTAYSAREFVTTDGYTIYVGTGPYDSYAGWMMDEDETYASILKAVKGDAETAEAQWILTGYVLDEDGDIGGTYIEISIDDQHMWYYENHKLVLDTAVVTGTETNPQRRTPRGLFYLLEMESPYVMHGDYGTQPCEYFIKVTWDGVAIHDADWQSSFGGTIYMYNGSHGCINTPHAVVAELYARIYAMDNWQMPVIIY